MTIQEMKEIKKQRGFSYARISDLTGVPLGTVQKIFSGETQSPRYDTLLALEQFFEGEAYPQMVQDKAAVYGTEKEQGEYTIEDYYALPEERRVELIDGVIYDMGAPSFNHQRIGGEIHRQIANYIYGNKGKCIPMMSPVDVRLDCDNKTMVQPDVLILCDHDKIVKGRVFGAPDFVLEVISPSTKRKDYFKKLEKYENAGVREYWILDPYKKQLLVFFFEGDIYAQFHDLTEPVPIHIYDGKLQIRFEHILKWCDGMNE